MNHLKRSVMLLLPLTALALAGCEEPPVEQVEAIKPVKTFKIEPNVATRLRNLPGTIDASQRATLSFRVKGTLNEIGVKEGDVVKKGDLLASLDPTDLQIVLNDAQATFDRADADFRRAEELIKDNFISRTDFDRLRADRKSASAALKQAKTNLGYTKLYAPFDGTIARRYVENFELVQAQQEIFSFSNTNQVEVKVNVPERLVLFANKEDVSLEALASFDNAPDKEFPLTMKEFAAKADPQTQTFEVTFLMDQPESIEVLPGMTASVQIEAEMVGVASEAYLIPITAVIAKADMKPRVWIVDPSTNKVSSKEVEIGDMVDDKIRVLQGLEPGDQVVTAGASFLIDRQEVRILVAREQADPSTAP
ncbi:efflux RND transporter periplasmic adaptor subunit [Paraferrimonas sedimenticola]|uniref:Multidrug resistance protein n=1 Tax=Paraferrimonas sedimenticola TaxID=375674 RepID=A0AA37RT87_9GAMM|nr:efflux RND transporter periplasmic adaptor subunit [Paraferrimonas sedimenticola]GLP95206.1 multidrug resistance protein [Paraferrimonas sedimenticola]